VILGLVAIGARSAGQGSDPSRGWFPLQFHSERICITVLGDSVEVNGFYRFLANAGPGQAVTLAFPYPQDSLLGGAETLRLEEIDPDGSRRDLRFQELPANRGAAWFLEVPAGDTLLVETVYRQHLRSCFARYIVTTTGLWKRPLHHARFEVALPPEIDSPTFSYPFEPQTNGEPKVWVFEASEFLPERDIEIRWKCTD
jgi:hypothetical protein